MVPSPESGTSQALTVRTWSCQTQALRVEKLRQKENQLFLGWTQLSLDSKRPQCLSLHM